MEESVVKFIARDIVKNNGHFKGKQLTAAVTSMTLVAESKMVDQLEI